MAHDNKTRFLADYVVQKLELKVKDVNVKELEKYFNENGWRMDDIDTMANKL